VEWQANTAEPLHPDHTTVTARRVHHTEGRRGTGKDRKERGREGGGRGTSEGDVREGRRGEEEGSGSGGERRGGRRRREGRGGGAELGRGGARDRITARELKSLSNQNSVRRKTQYGGARWYKLLASCPHSGVTERVGVRCHGDEPH
jgi:hypothetical protein